MTHSLDSHFTIILQRWIIWPRTLSVELNRRKGVNCINWRLVPRTEQRGVHHWPGAQNLQQLATTCWKIREWNFRPFHMMWSIFTYFKIFACFFLPLTRLKLDDSWGLVHSVHYRPSYSVSFGSWVLDAQQPELSPGWARAKLICYLFVPDCLRAHHLGQNKSA